MTSDRRMGPAGSANWNAMLDGAEEILREEGYAALTSRRVAECIGVKQRLVYYYFRTMEDLTIETFRRLAARDLERLVVSVSSDEPLREIWRVYAHTDDPRLISEFMALSNRITGLRTEVASYIAEARRIQVEALAKALDRRGIRKSLPPVVLTLFAQGLALLLNREEAIGVTTGHSEAMAIIEAFLAELEPGEETQHTRSL